MHFKTKVSPECYAELKLPDYKRNHGKYHSEVIGNTHIDYIFYSKLQDFRNWFINLFLLIMAIRGDSLT
jgi:hypothetical protein